MTVAAFGKLLGFLGKKTTVSATSSFAKSMATFNKVKGGLGGIRGGLETLGGSPVVAAFTTLINRLNMGSMEAQLNLMNTMMEFMKSPAGKQIFEGIISFLETIIYATAGLIKAFNLILAVLGIGARFTDDGVLVAVEAPEGTTGPTISDIPPELLRELLPDPTQPVGELPPTGGLIGGDLF